MRGEALRGHLDLLLLAAVRARPAHGYAIIENLRLRSGGNLNLPEGTVYPALHRLERAGLLKSRWSEASGRRRRTYEVTERNHRATCSRARLARVFASRRRSAQGFDVSRSRSIEVYLGELRRELAASRDASSPRLRTTSAKEPGTSGRAACRMLKQSGGSSNGSGLRG
jgi:PadR family transcriptional regulator, regulatory protein PadR